MKSLAVLHVSQLVTLAGPKRPRAGRELSELSIVPDGGMLICGGRIDVVGPSAEIEKRAGDAEVIDARGKVVLPGFVDAHTQYHAKCVPMNTSISSLTRCCRK